MEINNHKINVAIWELYRMVMVIDEGTRECQLLDYDKEMMNLPYAPADFDEFCNELRRNIFPEDRDAFWEFSDPAHVRNTLAQMPFISIECRLKEQDGCYYWVEITFCDIPDQGEPADQFMLLIRDVHERKTKSLNEIEDILRINLEFHAKYNELFEENMRDQQTGCYNRKGLKYYSDMVLEQAKSNHQYLFVCMADLNGLKYINDTYGHAEGDRAIAAISKELQLAAPKGAKIVRAGGDEFLLFCALDKDSKEPEEMGAKLDLGIEKYNAEHPGPFQVGTSYGWVLLPYKEGMESLDEYIRMADEKMYDMKVLRDEHRRM